MQTNPGLCIQSPETQTVAMVTPTVGFAPPGNSARRRGRETGDGGAPMRVIHLTAERAEHAKSSTTLPVRRFPGGTFPPHTQFDRRCICFYCASQVRGKSLRLIGSRVVLSDDERAPASPGGTECAKQNKKAHKKCKQTY